MGPDLQVSLNFTNYGDLFSTEKDAIARYLKEMNIQDPAEVYSNFTSEEFLHLPLFLLAGGRYFDALAIARVGVKRSRDTSHLPKARLMLAASLHDFPNGKKMQDFKTLLTRLRTDWRKSTNIDQKNALAYLLTSFHAHISPSSGGGEFIAFADTVTRLFRDSRDEVGLEWALGKFSALIIRGWARQNSYHRSDSARWLHFNSGVWTWLAEGHRLSKTNQSASLKWKILRMLAHVHDLPTDYQDTFSVETGKLDVSVESLYQLKSELCAYHRPSVHELWDELKSCFPDIDLL